MVTPICTLPVYFTRSQMFNTACNTILFSIIGYLIFFFWILILDIQYKIDWIEYWISVVILDNEKFSPGLPGKWISKHGPPRGIEARVYPWHRLHRLLAVSLWSNQSRTAAYKPSLMIYALVETRLPHEYQAYRLE